MRTRKSIPPKVAPTSSRWPANQPANRPNIHPRPSAASQTVGIEAHAKRKQPSTVAPRAAISARRPVKPRLTWATAASTTATASTLTAGRVEVVKISAEDRAGCQDCPGSEGTPERWACGHDGHGQGEPSQGVLQRMAQQTGRSGRKPRGDHARHEDHNCMCGNGCDLASSRVLFRSPLRGALTIGMSISTSGGHGKGSL